MTIFEDRGEHTTPRRVDLNELYFRIADENPKAGRKEREALYWAEVRDDEDYLRAANQCVCDLAHLALLRRQAAVLNAKASRKAAQARVKMAKRAESVATERVARKVSEKVQIALLALTMPNGKTLAESTGSECKQFGGWYAKLGDVVPGKARVGDHLTEAEVQKLWRKMI